LAGGSVCVSEFGFGADGDIDGRDFYVAGPRIVEWVVVVGDGDSVAAVSFAHVEPSPVDNAANDEGERFDPHGCLYAESGGFVFEFFSAHTLFFNQFGVWLEVFELFPNGFTLGRGELAVAGDAAAVGFKFGWAGVASTMAFNSDVDVSQRWSKFDHCAAVWAFVDALLFSLRSFEFPFLRTLGLILR
jgi:hypothetical protein